MHAGSAALRAAITSTPSARSARSRSSTTSGRCARAAAAASTSSVRHHAAGPRRQQHDPVGEQHRLLDVVRDEQHGPRLALERVRQPPLHLRARQRVERAERLVEAQQRPPGQQRAQERDALAHAARQLARAARARSPRARTRRSARAPPRAPRPSTRPATRSASAGVVERAQPRQQPVALRHQRRRRRVDRARVRRLQPAHELEQRRLAAPARPDDGDASRAAATRSDTPSSASTAPNAFATPASVTPALALNVHEAPPREPRSRVRIAPSAGITPQVRRVSARSGAISAGLRQPPCWSSCMLPACRTHPRPARRPASRSARCARTTREALLALLTEPAVARWWHEWDAARVRRGPDRARTRSRRS